MIVLAIPSASQLRLSCTIDSMMFEQYVLKYNGNSQTLPIKETSPFFPRVKILMLPEISALVAATSQTDTDSGKYLNFTSIETYPLVTVQCAYCPNLISRYR